MKVLIAEDDVSQQRLLQHLSRIWGYAPLVVGNGADAIEALEAKDLSLALLDWELPGTSGLDVCRSLRSRDRLVHAIVLTANDSVDDASMALEAGASDYLTKPFSRTELRARLSVGRRMLELHAELARAQKLESLGRLAAGVAHEINTPAQFVSDNVQFARDASSALFALLAAHGELLARARAEGFAADLADRVETLAGEIELDYLRNELPRSLEQSSEGIARIAEIVRAMKNFAHPAQSEHSLIDLNELVRSTATVSRHEWKHVASLELELDPALPLVPGVPGELRQVLLNILVNAAHAISELHGEDPAIGSLQIATAVGAGSALVRVRDNGGGIPESVGERVFDPFFTTKEVGRGTGQGLAIAYDVVVHRHAGRLWFESEAGVGATFCIELPLAAQHPEQRGEP